MGELRHQQPSLNFVTGQIAQQRAREGNRVTEHAYWCIASSVEVTLQQSAPAVHASSPARSPTNLHPFRNLPCKPLEPRFACIAAQLAFPHVDHVPPHLPQLFVLPAVAVSVARELRRPELHIRLRHVERGASLVHVPETAVHKHDRAVLGQHDVGVTRVPLVVFAESEPAREQIGAHRLLDRRVFAADARHGVAARAARVRGLRV